MSVKRRRCDWCGDDPLYTRYHDEEWGVPLHNDQRLFEMLILEGAQAGLSWITVLRKRDRYREVFDGFDPQRVARYNKARLERILKDPGIIRNRLKIESTVVNARAFLTVCEEHGSFDSYLWGFVDGRPIRNRWKTMASVPSKTPISDALSADLRARGFKFVGSTICYAFMQATGMVNDHLTSCWRWREI